MTANPHKETIFNQACEIEDDSERAAFIAEACGDDDSMREEIEQLLRLDIQRDSLFDFEVANLASTSDAFPLLEKPGDEIGPFKLLQKVGEGGMGVVYMAEQKAPVRRRVALKIIKPGMDTREVVARFEAERQALAMMDHPNIAKVLDCGMTQSGRPYFVMELVKGVSITKYCDANHLSGRERLELFVPVCKAIQHAHQKGIIHRDVKPSNILVAEYDHTPVPKIIDFGVAKALNAQLTDKTMFTQLGQIIGTIEYMSPEQAKVNQLDVDTRSDIYSLGVLLYELLTGAPPFDKKRLQGVAIDELMRILHEEDPPRPSTRLSTIETLPSVAANRNTDPKKLCLLLHGELDWIVMKALEKDRGRRYGTAAAFADDIQNYLNDDAVAACPPSTAYKFRKFARRNKVALVTASLVAAALIFGIVGTSWQAVRASRFAQNESDAKLAAQDSLAAEKAARQEAEHARIEEAKQRKIAVNERKSAEQARDAAETEALRANTAVDVLKELFASSDWTDELAKPANFTVRELLLNMADRLPQRLKDQPEVEAEVRAVIGRALTSFYSANEMFRAYEQLKTAWELRKRVYGDRHSKTIDSILDLSDYYWKIGNRNKAREYSQAAFELSRQLLNDAPKDVDNVISRLRSLRNSIRETGFRGKLPLCEEAVVLARTNSVNDDPHLAEILRIYADSKWEEHKTTQFETDEERDLSMQTVISLAENARNENARIFGSEHPMNTWCLLLLGKLELANANRESAKQYFQQGFDIQKQYASGGTTLFMVELETVLPQDELDRLVDRNFLFGGGFLLAQRAIAALEKGNLNEYQQLIARILENYDAGEMGPWYLAYACSLSKNAVQDWAPVVKRIRDAKPNSRLDEAEITAMLGSVLWRAGQTREAVKLLRSKLREWQPLKSSLWADSFVLPYVWQYELMLAMALHDEGDSEEAKQIFFKVANQAPRFLIGKEFAASNYITSRLNMFFEEAGVTLQISPDSFPLESGNPWSFVARGYIYRYQGQIENALEDYRRAIELKPDNWRLIQLRAELLNESGNHQQAINHYTTAISFQPENPQLHLVRGDLLAKLGQPDSAIKDYESALKFANNSSHVSNALKRRAKVHFEVGNLELALSDIRAALAAKPDNVSAVSHVGLVRAARCPDQKFRQVYLQLATRAVESGGKNQAVAYRNRGLLHREMGELQKAIADFRQALHLSGANRSQNFKDLVDCYRDAGQTIPTSDLDELIADAHDAAAWHQRGDFLNSAGQFELAIEDYSRALELDPNSHWSILNRGHCYFKNGTSDQAIVAAQAAKELALTDPKYQAHLCSLLELTRQFAPALEIANRLVELQPNSVDPIRRRANIYCQLKEYEKGIADYEKALKIKPKNQRLRLARLGALAANGQAESSRKELNKLIAEANKPGQVLVDFGLAIHRAGLVEQMEWAVEKAAEFGTGTESIMYYNLGCGHALAGDTDRAFAALKRSIELGESRAEMFTNDTDLIRIRDDPRFEELQAMLKWTEPYQAGLQNEKDGNMEAAIQDLARAIEINPQCGLIHNRRGLIYYRTRQFQLARGDFARFIELRPGEALAWSNRAAANHELADFEKSIGDANAALKLGPNYSPALEIRAKTFLALKRWNDAIGDYSKLIKLEPQKLDYLVDRGMAFAAAGDEQNAQTDFVQYIAAFDQAVEENPNEWQNINRRGVAKTRIRQWKQAITDFNRALELAPHESVLRKNIAHCLCELGQWKSAAIQLVRVLEAGDENWLTCYHLALCQLGADDMDGYRETCQTMASVFAESDDSQAANFTAWTCSLAPDALEDYSVVLKLAENARSKYPENVQFLKTLAAVHFRMGNYNFALEHLNRAQELDVDLSNSRSSSPAYTWYFLALAHEAIGNGSQAQDFLAKADAWAKGKRDSDSESPIWNRLLTFELMQAEASKIRITPAAAEVVTEAMTSRDVSEAGSGK